MTTKQTQPTTAIRTLKRACCVCKRICRGNTWHAEAVAPDEPISHGYCPACFEATIRNDFPQEAEGMLRRFLHRAACMVFIVGLMAGGRVQAQDLRASTRPYTIVDTGQTVCYDTDGRPIAAPKAGTPLHGQDAQYQGIAPAYRDNRDGTVSDLNTGLIWQKTPEEQPWTWQQAQPYADKLVLGGHDDWRLPTIKELLSIVDFSGSIHTQTPYINTRYFDYHAPDTSTGVRDIDAQYWSSNLYLGKVMYGQTGAFGFNFADGRIKGYPTDAHGPRQKRNYIRCVRGHNMYGHNDFHDNSDGTITDHATGLTWLQQDSAKPMDWSDALAYAEGLDHAGHSDWRLPNAKELQSIVDYSRAPAAKDPDQRTPAIDPIFTLTNPTAWSWTSTTHGDDHGAAVYLCFGEASSAWRFRGRKMDAHGAGALRSDPKSGSADDYPNGRGPQGDEIRILNYVRCVRGGTATPVHNTPVPEMQQRRHRPAPTGHRPDRHPVPPPRGERR